MKTVGILGSTGSIGRQALEVCARLGCRVSSVSGNRSVGLLEEQARRFHPDLACAVEEEAYRDLKVRLADTPVRVCGGKESLLELASRPGNDIVLSSIVGMAGLAPTLAALRARKTVALANKETLVAAGRLVTETAKEQGVELLPVDSEHSAIFQCLRGNDKKEAERILLTASGGPFYGKSRKELESVTAAQALKHPNWSMGAKITVDSATLMNKGLELIEAMWLFGMPPEKIRILVHRESILHSAVEYRDGCVIAQLGLPDMAIPIQYALTFPERLEGPPASRLDLAQTGSLTFGEPDEESFGGLRLAKTAAARGGLAPCVLSAANEAAVQLFLEGEIAFLEIEERVAKALETVPCGEYGGLEDVEQAFRAAQESVRRP